MTSSASDAVAEFDKPCLGDLTGYYAAMDDEVERTILQLNVMGGDEPCSLYRIPTIAWYDKTGTKLVVYYDSSAGCKPGGNSFEVLCISDETIHLLPAYSHPPFPGAAGAAAVLSVVDAGTLEPCPSSTFSATAVGLIFNNGMSEARIKLPVAVELMSCARQVTLLDYGANTGEVLASIPTHSPMPTPSPREVTWDQAIGLLKDCSVDKVTQGHSPDVWLRLDDGTEVHAVEPGINEVFGEVGELSVGCGPDTVLTE